MANVASGLRRALSLQAAFPRRDGSHARSFSKRRPVIVTAEIPPEAANASLIFRQQVTVYDAHPTAGQELSVPAIAKLTPWLYVMDGSIAIDGVRLEKGDAVTDLERPLPKLRANDQTTLVLFLVDRSAQASTAGTISGR